MRGSSVHFKRIASALHAVSHASRDVSPEYLLPADVSMGTHVVIDDHGQVQKSLDQKMHLASRQAKATKDYSPLWEGVINLPEPAPDVTPEHQIQIVRQWCKEYEAMTGHKVLRADVHLDEGYIGADGQPHFNAHAHVMCDRTDDKGKVKKLTSTVLREVQNMTAEVTTLQRGIDARKTGRKHIGHQNFRFDAEKNRLDVEKPKADLARLQDLSKKWSDTDLEKIKKLQAHIDSEPERLAAALAAQKTQLDEQYRLDRAALKASGDATQRDYQQLKKDHEADLAKLATAQQDLVTATAKVAAQAGEITQLNTDLAEARQVADKVPGLEDQISQQATKEAEIERLNIEYKAEIERLNAEYAEERAALKASGTAKQADYQQLKKDHEAELTTARQKLAEATAKIATQAGEITQLNTDLAEARQVVATARQELATASDKATEQAAQVSTLTTDLATAREQVATAQQERDDAKATATTEQAAVVTGLKADLAAALQQAATAQQERDSAKATATTEQAAVVTGLKADLAAALQQVATARQERDGAKATATTEQAAVVTGLKADLAAALQQAKDAQQERDSAKTTATAAQAAVVTGLKADLLEARQLAATAISEKDTLAQRYEAFKEKAQGVVGTQNQKIAELIGELGEAKNPVLRQLAPRIPQSNLQATASRPLEASKTAQEPPKRQEAPVPEKTPREVFLALYEGVKVVLVGMIDGMRLDAAEGRLGLFSSHSRSGPRVQVLCDVPENKVMPKIGEVFDSRAIPGKGKGGIGD